MATRSMTKTDVSTAYDFGWVVSWTGLTNTTSDDGSPAEMFGGADRSVQVHGTFGTNGTCLIEGSNDGTNYYTLTDFQGNALSITSAKVDSIAEITRYVRPRISNGDGSTSLTVTIMMRRPQR